MDCYFLQLIGEDDLKGHIAGRDNNNNNNNNLFLYEAQNYIEHVEYHLRMWVDRLGILNAFTTNRRPL